MSSPITFSEYTPVLTDAQIQTDDIEVLMLTVEAKRTNVIDDQLRAQMATINSRNGQIAKINTLLGKLASARASVEGNDLETWAYLGNTKEEAAEVYNGVVAEGLKMPTGKDEVNEPSSKSLQAFDARLRTIDGWVEQLKRKLDSLNSTQQMEMVQLQSLTNKRGEAYELLTTWLKTFNEMHSKPIRNAA